MKTKVAEAPTVIEPKSIVEQIASMRSAFSLHVFADKTGIDYNTAYDMYRDGRLPGMKIGSSIRLDPKTIAEWLRARTSA
jgi:excisionase family DNA binding protein